MSNYSKQVSFTDRSIKSVDCYLKDISKTKPLDTHEEYKLWQRITKGDISARNRLITSNLRYVVTRAKRFLGYKLPLEDLISAGNIGLCKAADKFDAFLGFRFISFATWYIDCEIQKYVKDSYKYDCRVSLNDSVYADNNRTMLIDLLTSDFNYSADWNLRYNSFLNNLKETVAREFFSEAANLLEDYIYMTAHGLSMEDVAQKYKLSIAMVKKLLKQIEQKCHKEIKSVA